VTLVCNRGEGTPGRGSGCPIGAGKIAYPKKSRGNRDYEQRFRIPVGHDLGKKKEGGGRVANEWDHAVGGRKGGARLPRTERGGGALLGPFWAESGEGLPGLGLVPGEWFLSFFFYFFSVF